MSDRREELLRQREAIRAHLAWLDREIEATADSATAEPVTLAPVTPIEPPATLPPAATTVPDASAEAILAEYRQPTLAIANQTKTGCVLYFILGMAVLIFAGTALYFGFKIRRGY